MALEAVKNTGLSSTGSTWIQLVSETQCIHYSSQTLQSAFLLHQRAMRETLHTRMQRYERENILDTSIRLQDL